MVISIFLNYYVYADRTKNTKIKSKYSSYTVK